MMAGSGPGTPAVAGGPARHIPVLARQAIGALAVRDGGVYLDATFGAGHDSRRIAVEREHRAAGSLKDQPRVAAGTECPVQVDAAGTDRESADRRAGEHGNVPGRSASDHRNSGAAARHHSRAPGALRAAV